MAINNGRYLCISDLQCPFEHVDALKFALKLKREYRILNENVYFLGDEVDFFWGSLYKKDPDADLTARTELEACRKKLKPWFRHFPQAKIAISNHGTRWMRKAFEAEIPSQMLRSLSELIESPPGWQWKERWLVKSKFPMCLEHGHNWSGPTPHKTAALYNGVSTIIGHHHSIAGIEFLRTALKQPIFGMCVGSMIDFEAYAFNYARSAKLLPILTYAVVVDDGRKPILEPLRD